MKILIAIVLAFVAFIVVTMLACLRVAAREDEIMKRKKHNQQNER